MVADPILSKMDNLYTEPSTQQLIDTILQVLKDEDTHVPSKPGVPHLYASQALHCMRELWYHLTYGSPQHPDVQETDPSDPTPVYADLSSHIAFKIGNVLHHTVQTALLRLYPDFIGEQKWDLGAVTGRVDGIYTRPDGLKVAVEIKTASPSRFNKAVSTGGPYPDHLIQAALSAYALSCDYVRLIYVRKLSSGADLPVADWLIPTPTAAALRELALMTQVVEQHALKVLPQRYAVGTVINDPLKAKWPCGLCPWREKCASDGPGTYKFTTDNLEETLT